MASLLEELKRRNVIRVAVGYLVLAWVVLQIADLVAPALLLPEWTLSFVTFIGIIGFPFALFFAWAFELTPEGIKRSEDVEPGDSITTQTAGSLNKLIIGLLCVAVVTLLLDRHFGLSKRYAPASDEQVVASVPAETEAIAVSASENEGPRSIAVLPFVNMSNDTEQEYFSDGISEELLNALAQIQELRVAARTSSFAFKGKNQDIKQIGEKLDVETVLEGSVRKSGARVRITAQLINVEDGYHLWSNTYDRDLTDIFAVQDEISAAIVEALKVHLTDGQALAQSRTVDVDAYNFLLQARHNVRLRTQTAIERAVKQYERALEIDPAYPQAWAGLAIATLLLSEDSYGEIPHSDAMTQGQAHLDKAFELDANLWEAHAGQALLYTHTEEWDKGLKSVNTALATNPSEGFLYLWKTLILDGLNEYDQSTDAIKKAYSVDPLHPSIQLVWADRLVSKGLYEEARRLVTPGTRSYYQVEWEIADDEGRWADMYTLLDEAADTMPEFREAVNRMRGMTLVFALYELEEALQYTMPHHTDTVSAFLYPEKAVEEWLTPQAAELGLADLEALMIGLMHSDRCEEALPLLDRLGLEDMQALPLPQGGHSIGSFAFYLSWCLNQAGEEARSSLLAEKMLTTIEQAMSNGRPHSQLLRELSALKLMTGDKEGALAAIREGVESNSFSYMDFHWIPYYRLLEGDSEFQRLRAKSLQHLNSERAKLGWEPVEA